MKSFLFPLPCSFMFSCPCMGAPSLSVGKWESFVFPIILTCMWLFWFPFFPFLFDTIFPILCCLLHYFIEHFLNFFLSFAMNVQVEPWLGTIFYFSPPDCTSNRFGIKLERRLFFNTVSSLVRAKVAGEWASDSTRKGCSRGIGLGIWFGFRVAI